MHSNHRSGGRRLGKVVLIALGIIVLLIGLGFLIQFLWNVTIAAMFDLPSISYWQAVGLFILAKLFFSVGSFRHRYKYRSKHWHKKYHDRNHESDSEDQSEPPTDATFTSYWQEEGKAAYEDFLIKREREDEQEN